MSNVFTERQDAFRASMVGNGSVASAAPSRLQTDQIEDDHDEGVTHSCGDCAGGAPCGNCGGNIRRDHPAYQALSWGMRTIQSGSDPFWTAAQVAQVVRDAPNRSADLEWSAVDSMIRRSQSLRVVMAQGRNAESMMMSAWRGAMSTNFDGPIGVPPGVLAEWVPGGGDPKPKLPTAPQRDILNREIPMQPVETGGYSCCPNLWYPQELTGPHISGRGTFTAGSESVEGVRVEMGFSFQAKFKPKTVPPCSCECCEFVHIIFTNHFTVSTNPFAPVDPRERGEDECEFQVYDPITKKWHIERHPRNWRGPGAGWESSWESSRRTKGITWDGPYCYGDRGRPASPKGSKREREGDPIPPPERKEPCKVEANDHPSIVAAGGATTTWLWESFGVVYDVCHRIVKRASYVMWAITVKVPSDPSEPVELDTKSSSNSHGDLDLKAMRGMSGNDEGATPDPTSEGSAGDGR